LRGSTLNRIVLNFEILAEVQTFDINLTRPEDPAKLIFDFQILDFGSVKVLELKAIARGEVEHAVLG
jgi:hypothetical protein